MQITDMKKYRCSSRAAGEEETEVEEGRRHQGLNWRLHTAESMRKNWLQDLCNVGTTQPLHQSDPTAAFRDYCSEYMSQTLPFFPCPHWQLHCTSQILPNITKCLSIPLASCNFGMAEHHCSRVPPSGLCTSEEEHGWSRRWCSKSIPYSN